MAVYINYFFNSDKDLEELAEAINACLGCDLNPYEGDAGNLFDRFLSMELSFCRAEGYEDDSNLNFEDYRYEIGIRSPAPDGDVRDMQLNVIAIISTLLYRRLGISDGMVIYDLQNLIARHEVRPRPDGGHELFDVVSEQFVEFPEYVYGLYTRIDQWQ